MMSFWLRQLLCQKQAPTEQVLSHSTSIEVKEWAVTAHDWKTRDSFHVFHPARAQILSHDLSGVAQHICFARKQIPANVGL